MENAANTAAATDNRHNKRIACHDNFHGHIAVGTKGQKDASMKIHTHTHTR